jgi:hypothetical protein
LAARAHEKAGAGYEIAGGPIDKNRLEFNWFRDLCGMAATRAQAGNVANFGTNRTRVS